MHFAGHFKAVTYGAVSSALAIDALTHDGPAGPARIDRAVCTQEFAPGVDPVTFPISFLNDRVIEVSSSDNVDLDAAVLRVGGVIAAYASGHERPSLPFWPMLFDNVTVRLLGSDDFTAGVTHAAAADLTAAAQDGALSITIRELLPLDAIATAHDAVDAGGGGRVLLTTE